MKRSRRRQSFSQSASNREAPALPIYYTLQEIEEAIANLVEKGLIADSGRRRLGRDGKLHVVSVATNHQQGTRYPTGSRPTQAV